MHNVSLCSGTWYHENIIPRARSAASERKSPCAHSNHVSCGRCVWLCFTDLWLGLEKDRSLDSNISHAARKMVQKSSCCMETRGKRVRTSAVTTTNRGWWLLTKWLYLKAEERASLTATRNYTSKLHPELPTSKHRAQGKAASQEGRFEQAGWQFNTFSYCLIFK